MKKSYVIALSGISSAFALICVVGAFYVDILTLTFSVLSAVFISLPLTKKYWAGGVLSYIGCSLCSFFICNIYALPFILFFGAYAIIQWGIDYGLYPKIKNVVLKYVVGYTIKLAYLQIIIAILWFLARVVIPIPVFLGKEIKLTYTILSLASMPLFLLYDIMMHFVFKNLTFLINKLVKDNKITTAEDFDYVEKTDVFGDDFSSNNDEYNQDYCIHQMQNQNENSKNNNDNDAEAENENNIDDNDMKN